MIQEILDAVGKIGPLAVAVAVYLANKRQTDWTNRIGRRAAEVEDQKLRLALLERRAVAIDAVREATQDFNTHGGVTSEVVTRIYEALKVAELVYDVEQEVQITSCMKLLHQWGFWDRQRARYRDSDDGKLRQAVDKQMDLEDRILDALQRLGRDLRTATKVSVVPQISPGERQKLRLRWLKILKRGGRSGGGAIPPAA
jgi:hypothetical protein